MGKDFENYDKYVPEDVLKEIDEYEKRQRVSRSRARTRMPSNEDIVKAILEVTGGKLTRYNVEDLYDNVVEYLRNQGFDTSMLTPSRVERLVSSLIKRGVLANMLE
ncbi:MAG: hypothetical protein LM582_05980 [Desulfurococcaceae archaeon]|jgi:glycerol-3-phosphate dehydrogenase|nr:hypothetical protein [Desulfurococcaceae archaeon]MCC6058007.1 hypothetical protein [Desulfurococcaceae archaeon]